MGSELSGSLVPLQNFRPRWSRCQFLTVVSYLSIGLLELLLLLFSLSLLYLENIIESIIIDIVIDLYFIIRVK